MRTSLLLLVVALCVLTTSPALAELDTSLLAGMQARCDRPRGHERPHRRRLRRPWRSHDDVRRGCHRRRVEVHRRGHELRIRSSTTSRSPRSARWRSIRRTPTSSGSAPARAICATACRSGNGIYRSRDARPHLGIPRSRRIRAHPPHLRAPAGLRTPSFVAVTGKLWGDSEPARRLPHPRRRTDLGTRPLRRRAHGLRRPGDGSAAIPTSSIAAMYEFRREPWFYHEWWPGQRDLHHRRRGRHLEGDPARGRAAGRRPRPHRSGHRARRIPNVVYAYVEAKENAIYRSVDGGWTWQQDRRERERSATGRSTTPICGSIRSTPTASTASGRW